MYQIRKLQNFYPLLHTFSTISDGNMSNVILGKNKNKVEVLKNRKKFLKKVGFDIEKTVCMWIQHGNKVVVANPEKAGISMRDKNFAIKCDGMITDQKNLNMFLLVADCAPVILYDPKKEVLGILHVGWKNADINSVSVVVEKLHSIYQVDPANLIVGIGPAARKDSFMKENPLQKNDPKWKPFLEQVDDLFKIDFVGLCRKQLVGEGVKTENIFDSGINTITDKRFYSHYRDKDKPFAKLGRFACVVGMKR